MNIHDKIFHNETILSSKIDSDHLFLVENTYRERILERFVDFSAGKHLAYSRYFEHFKQSEVFGYGNEAVSKILQHHFEGIFYLFIEEGSVIYKIIGGENVKKIISEWGSFDMYLTDENQTYILCFTNENNIVFSGDFSV